MPRSPRLFSRVGSRPTAALMCAAASFASLPQLTFAVPTPSTAVIHKNEERHVTARLELNSPKATPGVPLWLAIHFEIEKDWHIYWDGVNDTGFAPKLALTLPTGISAGKVLWPAPHRHVAPGDILDHIYEERVTLLVPLTVAQDAKLGKGVIRAELNWLVCSEACVPESQEVEVPLLVTAAPPGTVPGPDSPSKPLLVLPESFERALRALPQPVSKDKPQFTVEWTADTAKIQAPGATKLEFYPGKDGVELSDAITDAAAKADSLTLTLKPGTGSTPDASKSPGKNSESGVRVLQGILAVWAGTSKAPTYYQVLSERPAHPK